MAGRDGDGREFKDAVGSCQPPGVGVILVVELWEIKWGRSNTSLWPDKPLPKASAFQNRVLSFQQLIKKGCFSPTKTLRTQTESKSHVHTQRPTYCDAKQGPLDSRPSVLPAINDQDETHICRRQTGTHREATCSAQINQWSVTPARWFRGEQSMI